MYTVHTTKNTSFPNVEIAQNCAFRQCRNGSKIVLHALRCSVVQNQGQICSKTRLFAYLGYAVLHKPRVSERVAVGPSSTLQASSFMRQLAA